MDDRPCGRCCVLHLGVVSRCRRVRENVVIERTQGTIVLDFDAGGRVLGVEILGATRLLTPETLEGAEPLA
ncbi:DUF2283 domain-containing protein [Microbacterium sp. LAM7116]|uniref:DUF2283 domain-containing protein n=1 Tax=Microbacterium sulfonylureivorans TaxID=2486854 RepID=UPI000FDB153F